VDGVEGDTLRYRLKDRIGWDGTVFIAIIDRILTLRQKLGWEWEGYR
jgi:hypothetical protein